MSESKEEATTTEPEATPESGAALVEDASAELAAKVSDLEARLRTVSAAYRQKQDEIESTKRRLEERAALAEEIRRGEVVATLFEPVENLHRSLESVRDHTSEHGLRMVHQQFMQALQSLGLEEVPGVGSPFDPSVHEALATQPVSDEAQDNVVLNVFSAGYRIGRRLIRPARVVIGSYSPAPEA